MKRVKHHKIKTEKAECSTLQRVQEEHDLAHYIHDRVELMHQVFSILKYKELKSMAPECVRNLAVGDLEELCTEELLGISSKRLLTILDGVDPPSDTESSSPSPPPEQLETISLDSISSDEELLASNSKKKKHKHHRHGSKSKSRKKAKSKEKESIPHAHIEETSELSRASRAGLTVLELLELQARARAIRAQLQQEQANKRPSEMTAAESSHPSSENEVEIKEEPADVVEISSEDEKPDVDQLKENIAEKLTSPKVAITEPEKIDHSQTITKRVNDLTITVPQAVRTRKIRLNRNKINVSMTNNSSAASTEAQNVVAVATAVAQKLVNTSNNIPQKPMENKPKKKKKDKKKKTLDKDGSDHDEITLQLSDSEKMDLLEDLDESRKNYDRVSSSSEDTESSSSDSEDDNISDKTSTRAESNTLQNEIQEENQKALNSPKDSATKISPSGYSDESSLMENFKGIDNSHSNDSKALEENEGNMSGTNTDVQQRNDTNVNPSQNIHNNLIEESIKNAPEKLDLGDKTINNTEDLSLGHKTNDNIENLPAHDTNDESKKPSPGGNIEDDSQQLIPGDTTNDDSENIILRDNTKNDTEKLIAVDTDGISLNTITNSSIDDTISIDTRSVVIVNKSFGERSDNEVMEITSIEDITVLSDSATISNDIESQKVSEKNYELTKKIEHGVSDGELSDRQSSEVEALDVQPEVVCISDEESPKKKHGKKKKKKKEKKSKKSKKLKSDFREGSDQKFYKDVDYVSDCNSQNLTKSPINATTTVICDNVPIDLDSDDVYEYLELSDDSSCYEVEGTVLSKEPTAEEIEALSAKIDAIEHEDVVTDEINRDHEQIPTEKEMNEPDEEKVKNISWKDRYLDSNKVKKVLTTGNILNALRKKNKELKKKIQESKKREEIESFIPKDVPKGNIQLEEGSLMQYNALEASTKYVDPVKETVEENKDHADDKEQTEKLVTESEKKDVTREMKKEAKQLLKMYRRLFKHNDMNKQKDPSKKKKKKQKKKTKQTLENK